MPFEMNVRNNRIEGWKAIGAYLGRERTTVIRWTKDRGLPVHAMPGGRTRRVYALKDELDAWRLSLPPTDITAAISGVPVAAPVVRARSKYARLVTLICASAAALIIIATFHRDNEKSLTIPHDPKLAQRFIKARDEIARRDARSLGDATSDLNAITLADPDFALAQAGLADAYILAREFGSIDDSNAFPKIEQAARRALAIDPDLASAHRAIAFVDYWWKGDGTAAAKGFRRALDLDDEDGFTHLWYANILADNGDIAAAAREFETAKRYQPGAPSIRIDEAWAIWSAGDDARAQAMLTELAQEQPMLATIYDCLSFMALGRGDLVGYASELAQRAKYRNESGLSAYANAVGKAVANKNIDALALLMLERARNSESGNHSDLSLEAFFESSLGRRAALINLLSQAESRHERWSGAGLRLHIARRWHNDSEVMRLLRRRTPPPLV
ncbi:hypothetical protein [Sphingomonas sp. GB1N7]|uniref:hypothetical protein n=1 Tax=Parasphingomonas caseinilytica TaxID=3096158 RepID=UPI002FCC1E50